MSGPDWKPILERDSETLTIFQVAKGRDFYHDTLEIDFIPKELKYENKTYYLDTKEMMEEYITFKRKYDEKPEFFRNLAGKAIMMGENLVRTAIEVSKSVRSKGNKELAESFVKYNDSLLRYVPFVWSVFTVEKILTERLNEKIKNRFPSMKESELMETFMLLTTPRKESSLLKEYKAMLSAAVLYKRAGTITDQDIREVHKKFSWLGAMNVGWTYLKEPYNTEHYMKAIQEFATDTPEEKLSKLAMVQRNRIKEYQCFVNNNKLDKDITKESELLSEFILLRTTRGEYIVQSQVYASEMLKEIASRFGLDIKDIVYFTPDEIVKMLLEDKIPEFQNRKGGFKIFIDNGNIEITPMKSTEST
jgi:hypothetical protein